MKGFQQCEATLKVVSKNYDSTEVKFLLGINPIEDKVKIIEKK